MPKTEERRIQQRCTKDIGMYCSPIHGRADRFVMLRNFNDRGVYFESTGDFTAGSFVVLRMANAKDFEFADPPPSNLKNFSIKVNDPNVCAYFRSHVVARVQRCIRLSENEAILRYGVGAEIQMLSDYY